MSVSHQLNFALQGIPSHHTRIAGSPGGELDSTDSRRTSGGQEFEGHIIQQRVRIESTYTVFRVEWTEGECFGALNLKRSPPSDIPLFEDFVYAVGEYQPEEARRSVEYPFLASICMLVPAIFSRKSHYHGRSIFGTTRKVATFLSNAVEEYFLVGAE